ncbi:hypothetical protein BV25DRAFT_1831628 [Artomyces pyxidatus]|uniref:Uncharacterized protein n=1 Tax=Artomyces pyxidatus TaxID=48021 RepID=A0ACB8SMP9_9AGAM|nr:hypothetical protein BV25DRAFT_1831628 [Artomyces pyxidatus]
MTTPMAQWADFETFMSSVNRVHFQEVRPTWHDKQWGWLSSAGLFIDDERKWESRWISGLTTVWYCRDVATGEEKVAKFVEHDSDEIKVLRRLSAMRDPAIKSAIFPHHIVDCGEAAMILMPRMEAGAFARWAHMGGAVTLRAVGDIAAGLSAFHRRGIAVADVDANNMIFEDSGGRGYVIDMGSAIMLPDNYRPGDLIDIWTAVRLDNHPPEGLLGVDPLAFDAWGLGLFLCLVSTRVRWAYPEFSELDIFKAGALSELMGMMGSDCCATEPSARVSCTLVAKGASILRWWWIAVEFPGRVLPPKVGWAARIWRTWVVWGGWVLWASMVGISRWRIMRGWGRY